MSKKIVLPAVAFTLCLFVGAVHATEPHKEPNGMGPADEPSGATVAIGPHVDPSGETAIGPHAEPSGDV